MPQPARVHVGPSVGLADMPAPRLMPQPAGFADIADMPAARLMPARLMPQSAGVHMGPSAGFADMPAPRRDLMEWGASLNDIPLEATLPERRTSHGAARPAVLRPPLAWNLPHLAWNSTQFDLHAPPAPRLPDHTVSSEPPSPPPASSPLSPVISPLRQGHGDAVLPTTAFSAPLPFSQTATLMESRPESWRVGGGIDGELEAIRDHLGKQSVRDKTEQKRRPRMGPLTSFAAVESIQPFPSDCSSSSSSPTSVFRSLSESPRALLQQVAELPSPSRIRRSYSYSGNTSKWLLESPANEGRPVQPRRSQELAPWVHSKDGISERKESKGDYTHRATSSTNNLTLPRKVGGQPIAMNNLREGFASILQELGKEVLLAADMLDIVKKATEKEHGALSPENLEVLKEAVRRWHADSCLMRGIGTDEWMHMALLRACAPSGVAARNLNKRLRAALTRDDSLLQALIRAFTEAGGGSDGLLHGDSWSKACDALVDGGQVPVSAGALSLVMLGSFEAGLQDALGYYELVCLAVGAQSNEVELALYDLSAGMARWVPPALLGGRRFEGVWHSGVRAFDREFWFGGMIIESKIDSTPFGKPVRVIPLGVTWLSKDELLDFIRNDLYNSYNPRSYDVLKRNCNNFSNELTEFLVRGKEVPHEVLMQPQWARNTVLVQAIQPALNQWLGGFGVDAAHRGSQGGESDRSPGGSNQSSPGGSTSPCRRSPTATGATAHIDDLTEEWRQRLRTGDVVLRRARFTHLPKVVRILKVAEKRHHGNLLVDVVAMIPGWDDIAGLHSGDEYGKPFPDSAEFHELLAFEAVVQLGVRVSELYPLVDQTSTTGALILRASLMNTDSRTGDVLQRSPDTPFGPACPRGHRLRQVKRSWFAKVPACEVCGTCHSNTTSNAMIAAAATELPESDIRWGCGRCSYEVCGACLAEGLRLGGCGVFVDLLSWELADALLTHPGWLRYKARCFFYRADHNAQGSVDWSKVRRAVDRMYTVLGCKLLGELELAEALSKLRRFHRQKLPNDPVELNEQGFAELFDFALRRALAVHSTSSSRQHVVCNVGSPGALHTATLSDPEDEVPLDRLSSI